MSVYKEKDFVDVVDADDVPFGSVPEAWLGTSLLPEGVKKAKSGNASGSKPEEPVEIPEGDPEEAWTAKQLDAYAEREGIDLAGTSSKADKVAAIELAKEAGNA